MHFILKAPLFSPCGYSEAARNLIKELHYNNYSFHLEDVKGFPGGTIQLPSETESIINYRLKSILNPDAAVSFDLGNRAKPIRGVPNYLITMFEGSNLPPTWRDNLRHFDRVLTPSNFVQTIFQKSGIKSSVLEFGVDLSRYNPNFGSLFSQFEGKMVFLWIGEWIKRKGYDIAIRSFCKTFGEEHNVVLILKTYPTIKSKEQIIDEIQLYKSQVRSDNYPKIFLLTDMIELDDMVGLYNSVNVVIHPARAEGYGMCLTADTWIHCKSKLKKIQDIEIGDEVITHLGRYRKVTKLYQRKTSTLIEIKKENIKTIKCTENHPILIIKSHKCPYKQNKKCTPNCSKNAYKLKNGNWAKCQKEYYKNYNPEWVEAKNIKKEDYVLFPIKESNIDTDQKFKISNLLDDLIIEKNRCYYRTAPQNSVLNEIFINEDFARLSGYYCSEGCSYSKERTLSFSFNIKENKYIRDCLKLMQKVFDVKGKVYKYPERNAVEIIFNNSILNRLFAKLFGRGSENKFISDLIKNTSEKNKIEFLIGYIRGDGYTKNEYIDCTTISPYLIIDLFDLGNQLNLIGTIRSSKNSFGTTVFNYRLFGKQTLILEASKKRNKLRYTFNKSWRWNNYICYVINSVTQIDVEEIDVYNFDVEEDHSYVANGCIVHNCVLEAAACGKPIIATNYSSYMEYLDSKNMFLVDYKLISAVNEYDVYKNSQWAEPNESTISRHLQYIYEHKYEAELLGMNQSSFIRKNYSWKKTAEKLHDLLVGGRALVSTGSTMSSSSPIGAQVNSIIKGTAPNPPRSVQLDKRDDLIKLRQERLKAQTPPKEKKEIPIIPPRTNFLKKETSTVIPKANLAELETAKVEKLKEQAKIKEQIQTKVEVRQAQLKSKVKAETKEITVPLRTMTSNKTKTIELKEQAISIESNASEATIQKIAEQNKVKTEIVAAKNYIEKVKTIKDKYPHIKLSVGIICLNEEEYIEICLKSIYQHAHEIIIAEGACQLYLDKNPDYVNKNGSSTDRTVEIIRNFPDPDNKILLVQGLWKNKGEQRHQTYSRMTGTHYLLVDADEIYKSEDLDIMFEYIDKNPQCCLFSIPFIHFWKEPKWQVIGEGSDPGYWNMRHPRLFKRDSRYYYDVVHDHGHTTLKDENGKWMFPFQAPYKGNCVEIPINIYHYGYMKSEKNIMAKEKFYEARRGTEDFIWHDWKPGMPAKHSGKVIEFKGEHPEIINCKKNIVLLISKHGWPPFGGGEKFLESLVDIYKEFNYEPIVVGFKKNSKGKTENFKYRTYQKYNKEFVKQMFDEFSPKLIHTLSGTGYEIVAEANIRNIKVIYGVHFWRDMFDMKYSYLEIEKAPKNYFKEEFVDLLTNASLAYCNSQFTQDVVFNRFGVLTPIVMSLPNFAEKRLKILNYRENVEEFILLTNAEELKGFSLIKELAKRIPHRKFAIIANQSNYELIVKKTSNYKNIKVFPKQDEMIYVYSQTKLLLCPSFETFGRVIVEAQQLKIPCIGIPQGNLKYLLEDSGILIAKNRLDIYEKEIEKIFTDAKYYDELVQKAYKNSLKYSFGLLKLSIDNVLKYVNNPTLVCVGSGIGNVIQTLPAIRQISKFLNTPLDISIGSDAKGSSLLFKNLDFVNCVSENISFFKNRFYKNIIVFACFGSFDQNEYKFFKCFEFKKYLQMSVACKTMHESIYNLECLKYFDPKIQYNKEDSTEYQILGNIKYSNSKRNIIGIHAGCKDNAVWKKKQWPYFCELVTKLASKGFEIRSFGSKQEYVLKTRDFTGTNLEETIRNMLDCNYFISNDSGIYHIADILKIPGVVLFGPSSIVKNGPINMNFIQSKNCNSCQFTKQIIECKNFKCMREISIDEVFDKVMEDIYESK